jgi:hypothetical protein
LAAARDAEDPHVSVDAEVVAFAFTDESRGLRQLALLGALYGLLAEGEDFGAHSPNIHRNPLATTTAKKAQAAPMPMAIGMAFTLPS